MNEFEQVDALVDQVRGNSYFLQKILFGRVTFIALGIVSAVFLIAAISTH
ncbi:MAG: hypothetical protein JW757_11725 [Anaerolineales bacterium]|nr:hypothetical protein [Anaerolineales bacterium]